MSISVFISLIFAFWVMNPSSTDEATKSKVLNLALVSLEQQMDMNTYQVELEPRWIPNSLLKVGPENIVSVSVLGNVEEFTRFSVTHLTGTGQKSTEIQLRLKAKQLVAVALDRIKTDVILTTDKFELQWRAVKLGKDRFISEISELQGKSIRRSLLPGQPVRKHEISNPILVIPGGQVNMLFTSGTIELGLNCESRQSGSIEEEILIYCQETRKKYTAKVKGSGEVQWLRTH